MPPESPSSRDYFDTPARAERLQLLLHLVRNAGEVVYLRGPAGAGKTRFANRMLEALGDDAAVVWLNAGIDQDLVGSSIDQLGLDAGELTQWPDGVLAELGEQELLVVVDDADSLGLDAIESLATLHVRGGHLLLIGQGGLAQTKGDWDVQFVDLPPFDPEQATAFLRSNAGSEAPGISDDLAAALHRAAKGLPGPLLEALNEVMARAGRRSKVRPRPGLPGKSRSASKAWLAGGVVVAALLGVLAFQDQINALFEPAAVPDRRAVDIVSPPGPAAEIERAAEPRDGADRPADDRAPARLPEIALPELSRVPPSLPTVATLAAPVEVDAGNTVAPSPVDAPLAVRDDLLDAVMQDALTAAEAPSAEAESARLPAAVGEPGPASPSDHPVQAPHTAPANAVAPAPEAAVVPPLPVAPPAAASPQMRHAAPVEERVSAAPAKLAPPAAATRAVPPKPIVPPAEAVPGGTVGGGSDWLNSRSKGRYTLQLVGSRNRASVEKFVRDHKIAQPYAIFERKLDGRPWYSLVAGDYPDRDSAAAARERLPESLARSGVWPRTFESIMESL